MVLLHKKHHIFKKAYVRGHSGGSILQFLPTLAQTTGKIAQNLISKISLGNIAKQLGGYAVGSLASYGVKKFLERPKQEVANAVHGPELTIGPEPQGLINGDLLPVTSEIEIINPKNHVINLPDGIVKSTTEFHKKIESPPEGLRRKNKYAGRGIKKILNNKSKEILNGIIGSGIYNLD